MPAGRTRANLERAFLVQSHAVKAGVLISSLGGALAHRRKSLGFDILASLSLIEPLSSLHIFRNDMAALPKRVSP